MPSMELLGRRWKVASDDFVYPMLSENIIRFLWFVLLLAILLVYRQDLSLCQRELYLKAYCTGILIILGINIFFNFILMRNSMKGNIFDESRMRRLVPCMVVGKFILFVPEIVWMCLGTALLFSDLTGCPSGMILTLKIALGLSWALLVLLMAVVVLIFDPLGNPSKRNEISFASRIWKLRCKLCCCWMNQNEVEKDSFDEISKLLAAYFHGIDLTVTDIATGLVLLNEKQKWRSPESRKMLTPFNMDYVAMLPNASSKPEEWMTLDNAKHFFKYALGSYGWLFFVYDNMLSGPLQLCCCRVTCGGLANVHGDKCCHCNTNAILQQTGIDRKDILYATFENKLFEIPFYVAFDHNYKSIVVSVRGTLSFYDAITDLRIESQNMDLDVPFEALAHKGILHAAMYIKDSIVQKKIISEAFEQHPDYKLVVTGHSLGAGAASLLSALLRPIYPDLICFAFSPPGWLVSLPLSQYMESFVCSIVVGKDLVPRLGVYTLNSLKSKMLNVIRQTEQPKYRVLFRAFKKACCGGSRKRLDENLLLPESVISEPISVPQDIHPVLDNPTPLYLPGRIIYLELESTTKRCCRSNSIYKAYWAKREFFNEILISPKMVTHHRPDIVYKTLKSILNQEHI